MQQSSSTVGSSSGKQDTALALVSLILSTVSLALFFLADIFPVLLGAFGLLTYVNDTILAAFWSAGALPSAFVACLLAGGGVLCARTVRRKRLQHTTSAASMVESTQTISKIGMRLGCLTLLLVLVAILLFIVLTVLIIVTGGDN